MRDCYCPCFYQPTMQSFLNDWTSFLSRPNTFAIIDSPDKSARVDLPNTFIYNEADIRRNLNFPHAVSKRHFWNSHGNRNLVWFYAHLRMLNFFLSQPDYDYYWFFDDDVKCANWDVLLGGPSRDIDFLSYFVFKNAGVLSQPSVPTIDGKTYSGTSWFGRFPGDGDILPSNVPHHFGSFFPIVRMSNAVMRQLISDNDLGFRGYSEGFVPTILNHRGYKLDTLLESDNTSRHFDTDETKILHKNQTIKWEWI